MLNLAVCDITSDSRVSRMEERGVDAYMSIVSTRVSLSQSDNLNVHHMCNTLHTTVSSKLQ